MPQRGTTGNDNKASKVLLRLLDCNNHQSFWPPSSRATYFSLCSTFIINKIVSISALQFSTCPLAQRMVFQFKPLYSALVCFICISWRVKCFSEFFRFLRTHHHCTTLTYNHATILTRPHVIKSSVLKPGVSSVIRIWLVTYS